MEYGEGPTRMQKGGGFSKMKGQYGPQDIRYTRKGNTVYALILGWPGANTTITMKMFGQGGLAQDIKVTKMSMLGTRERIKWQRQTDGLVVYTPNKKVDDMAIVFKLKTSGL